MAGRKKQKLDPRKSIFISEILTGKNGAAAARAAGIEKKNASRQAHRWQNDPAIAEEIEQGLAAIRQDAEVTCESMIRQLDADRQFAIKTENASAATRASELKAKLVGLMIDRRDVRAAHIVKAEDHSTRDVALAINALIQDADLVVMKRNGDAPATVAALEGEAVLQALAE
jgi:phage terminase small subunit